MLRQKSEVWRNFLRRWAQNTVVVVERGLIGFEQHETAWSRVGPLEWKCKCIPVRKEFSPKLMARTKGLRVVNAWSVWSVWSLAVDPFGGTGWVVKILARRLLEIAVSANFFVLAISTVSLVIADLALQNASSVTTVEFCSKDQKPS